MIRFLLRFFGKDVDAAQEVSSVTMQLRHASWLGWIVCTAIVLSAFAWAVYRYGAGHRGLSPGRRRFLTALRILLFLLILFILLRPVVTFTVENRLRRALVILIDKSASMDIEDQRLEDADLKRVETVTGTPAAQTPHIARADLVTRALDGKPLKLISQVADKYDVEFSVFDRDIAAVQKDKALAPGSPTDDARQSTAIGDAVRDVLNRKRGQPVAGIFLVTDGANNAGSEPLEAATAALEEHIPLYTWGVGITSPRDVIVDSVFTPDVAFIKDQVAVTVRVRAQGLKNQKGKLSLKYNGEEVATKDVDFSIEGEQAVPITFTPKKPGVGDLIASIAPREDETVKDNNSASQRLRVIDSKIKVLYVEQRPRWEFRFLQSALLRDRRIAAKFLLLQASPELSTAADSPYVASFPATKEELFKYDLVVIGDVEAKTFSKDQTDALTEFVSKFGGALLFIAGQQFDPSSYTGTELAKLLPVEILPSGGFEERRRATTVALTSLGASSPMLRLSPNEQENSDIWHNFPPVDWVNHSGRAKPGAQVLLEDTDPTVATRQGRMPVMALQQYGVGQVLYMGTDDSWRWRQDVGLAYYPLLWGQIVQRMALAHLLGGSKRTQLSVDKQKYSTGDRVTVFARLYDEAFAPVKLPGVDAFSALQPATPGDPMPPKQGVQLRALPDQPGMYRGDFVAGAPGNYKFSVASDPATTLDFAVSKPRFELGETAMNEPLLKEMARISGGAFFREEDLSTLPQKLADKDERISRSFDAELWSSPLFFILITIVAITEWLLRKRYNLK